MVQHLLDAIEGDPVGATNIRKAIAPAVVEEVLSPIPIPFCSDEGGIVRGIAGREHFSHVIRESTGVYMLSAGGQNRPLTEGNKFIAERAAGVACRGDEPPQSEPAGSN